MGVHGGKAWFPLCEKLLEKCGYSLFLLKPIGKLWEKVKSVVFTFSVKYQILSSHAYFRADENLRREIERKPTDKAVGFLSSIGNTF